MQTCFGLCRTTPEDDVMTEEINELFILYGGENTGRSEGGKFQLS
jgi:hypothetical protein